MSEKTKELLGVISGAMIGCGAVMVAGWGSGPGLMLAGAILLLACVVSKEE